MKRTIITIGMAVIGSMLTAPAHAADVPWTWGPCQTEDQTTRCVWDAKHMGNGEGQSFFVTRNGTRVKVRHQRAHRMLKRGEFHREVLAGSYEECLYTGQWNPPCVWDNEHSQGADLYTNDWSYILADRPAQRLPHRIAHYALGF